MCSPSLFCDEHASRPSFPLPPPQWIDKIRTPRASNEARQAVFARLNGELQRKIGLKVLEMGGNAVLGYRPQFDLEGDSMVARGIGTVAALEALQSALPDAVPSALLSASTSPLAGSSLK